MQGFVGARTDELIPRVTIPWEGVMPALAAIAQGFVAIELAAIVVFATPEAPLDELTGALHARFPRVLVAGCSTAGEIGTGGYIEGGIVAIGLPRQHFQVAPVLFENLSRIDARDVTYSVLRARQMLDSRAAHWTSEFAVLLVDGLSMKEDRLVGALNPALGPIPLFGGSAGDALDFRQTRVSVDGVSASNAAVLLLVRSDCPVRVFRFDNFEPTDVRMVVTSADVEARLVHEINGEVAAREYARLVGINPDTLSPLAFAAHPVLVRVGGQTHVRAIQKVEENGHLRFFSAIDTGLVLTVARGLDMTRHLKEALISLSDRGAPRAVIAFDCILRRLDAQQTQQSGAISRLLDENGVVGFSTYGEQFNGLHVNQTFTGVAIYPPTGEAA